MHCANPECFAESLYFRSGSLHWMDRKPLRDGASTRRVTRMIWLCAACSENHVVETWRPVGQQLRFSQEKVVPIYRDRRRPNVKAMRSYPISQSA